MIEFVKLRKLNEANFLRKSIALIIKDLFNNYLDRIVVDRGKTLESRICANY